MRKNGKNIKTKETSLIKTNIRIMGLLNLLMDFIWQEF